MTKSELFDRLEHDLVSAIRNFQVADRLLGDTPPDVKLATELLRASIEQLEGLRLSLPKTKALREPR